MSAPYSCHGTRQASTPWAMSLYFKFRAIYLWLLNEYQWWDQAKIYDAIYEAIGSCVKSWSHLVTKQNWYTKNISTRLRLRALKLSKTKIPITIVKAQMPSNPSQKSRMRDNKPWTTIYYFFFFFRWHMVPGCENPSESISKMQITVSALWNRWRHRKWTSISYNSFSTLTDNASA